MLETLLNAVIRGAWAHQRRSTLAALALGAAHALAPALAVGQQFVIPGVDVQKAANGILALMGYTLTPDVTTGELAISNEPTGNPDLGMTTLGGGFTLSRSFPLYLEGTLGYIRYDPTFIASNGQVSRPIPVKWNSISATGGIGWDFPIAKDWVIRPIFNFSFGRLESDLAVAGRILENQSGADVQFLQNGKLKAYGLGGSLMLDYERYRPENDIDLELRWSNIRLRSFGDSSEAVQGSADARSLNLWSRWRAPTGKVFLERPLRYVLEYAHSGFFGDLKGALGYDRLNSVGVGLEVDSSKYDIIVTRTRLMARYRFGENVRGWSAGLAISF